MTDPAAPSDDDTAAAGTPGDGVAEPTSPTPAPDLLHFEDFQVGESETFGSYPVTREEIVAFATEFDPQPFHLDDAAAAESLLGGLAASGWHTCAMTMRLICDGYLNRSAGLGAPGVDEVRWLKPVRPGDTLSVRRTCLEARISASRPELGLVKFHYEALNQTGDIVMTWTVPQMFRVCAPDTGSAGNDTDGGGGEKDGGASATGPGPTDQSEEPA